MKIKLSIIYILNYLEYFLGRKSKDHYWSPFVRANKYGLNTFFRHNFTAPFRPFFREKKRGISMTFSSMSNCVWYVGRVIRALGRELWPIEEFWAGPTWGRDHEHAHPKIVLSSFFSGDDLWSVLNRFWKFHIISEPVPELRSPGLNLSVISVSFNNRVYCCYSFK